MRAPQILPPVQRKAKRPRRSLLLTFLGFMFAAGVVVFLAGSAIGGFFLWRASSDLPSYESLSRYEPPVMTRIHAHDGSLISEYARERRIFVPINTVPKLLIGAYLSAEDKRFFDHGGLDFQGMARASYRLAMNMMQGRDRRAEGASTITQQVAKNFLLSSDRTVERKLKEAILAIRIERAYSKEKILELYLNEIYLGIGSYGVAAASLNYFNKELKDLSIEEMAYLAALPKAPNNYHPFRRTKEATARRNAILSLMAENGYITEQEAATASAKPLQVNIRQFGIQTHAADYFAEEVRRTLIAQFGEEKLYSGGLSVRTTLSPQLQTFARRALVDGLVAFDRKTGWRGAVDKIDVSGDWGVPLGAIEAPGDIQPWRLGVVLQASREKAVVGLRPTRRQDGSLAPDRVAAEVPYDEVKWANKKPGKQPGVTDILNAGDVVYVAPKNPDDPQGVWSLMQIPEVGGGMVVMDPHTGRVLAMVGGFSFALSQFDRAPGAPPARLLVQAVRLRGCARQRLQADQRDPRCADYHRARRGTGRLEAAQLQRAVLWADDTQGRHRAFAQPHDGASRPGHGHAARRRVFAPLWHLRRADARPLDGSRRRRDHIAEIDVRLRGPRERRPPGPLHADRPHPGPLGSRRLAA